MKLIAIAVLSLASSILAGEFRTVEVTAYCNNHGKGCKICNGNWARLNKTASGQTPKEGVTCAASRAIPFGTVLFIPGVGKRVVQDRTSLRFEGRIDIYFNSHKSALAFGKKRVKIRV